MHVVWLTNGMPKAAALMAAPFVAATAIVGAVTTAWETALQESDHPLRRLVRRRGRWVQPHCALCRTRLTKTSSIWVCDRCDCKGAAVAAL